MSPAQADQLESFLIHDSQARQYYFDLIDIAKALRDTAGVAGTQVSDAEEIFTVNEGMLRALAELEKTAPTVSESASTTPKIPQKTGMRDSSRQRSTPPGSPSRFWLRIVKLAVAACVGLILFVWLNPGPPIRMCMVSAVHNAQWEDPSRPLSTGDAVFDQDKPRTLKSGIIKLTFDHQTEAIVEGPATFSCKLDNQLILQVGKVCAYVPQAKNGFEVRTPYSNVLDLGTEFGVSVNSGGNLVQVFQGEVSLKTPHSSHKMITAGIAQKVNSVTKAIGGAYFEPEAFVRYVNKEGTFIWHGQGLDLVDVVADGNGFGSGLPNMGISVMTGFRGDYQGFGQIQRGRRQYLPVPGSPLVDGVFSVWGDGQVVSSTGLIWRDCPLTSGLFTEGVIRCGARYYGIQNSHIPAHGYRLAGITYNTSHDRALSIPANTGITFDLNAIRQTLLGVGMEAFTATCGLSETFFDYQSAMQFKNDSVEEPCADFFVLMDGRPAFIKRDVCPSQGAVEIKVPIRPDDRFLTLAVTEGRDEQFVYDWALFAGPRIRLQRQ